MHLSFTSCVTKVSVPINIITIDYLNVAANVIKCNNAKVTKKAKPGQGVRHGAPHLTPHSPPPPLGALSAMPATPTSSSLLSAAPGSAGACRALTMRS
jgi:hypothetical protein